MNYSILKKQAFEDKNQENHVERFAEYFAYNVTIRETLNRMNENG